MRGCAARAAAHHGTAYARMAACGAQHSAQECAALSLHAPHGLCAPSSPLLQVLQRSTSGTPLERAGGASAQLQVAGWQPTSGLAAQGPAASAAQWPVAAAERQLSQAGLPLAAISGLPDGVGLEPAPEAAAVAAAGQQQQERQQEQLLVELEVRPPRQRPGDRLAEKLARAREGLAALADPAAAAAAEAPPPPLQKPVLEAVEKLRQTDLTPVVDTVGRAFEDLRAGFSGLAQSVLPPGGGEEGTATATGTGIGAGTGEAAAGAEAPAPAEAGGAAAAGAEGDAAAAAAAPAGGSRRVGDSLRETLERVDAHGKVLETAREMGKRASALVQRGGAPEALVRGSGSSGGGSSPAEEATAGAAAEVAAPPAAEE